MKRRAIRFRLLASFFIWREVSRMKLAAGKWWVKVHPNPARFTQLLQEKPVTK
jgi:hypothetical protein